MHYKKIFLIIPAIIFLITSCATEHSKIVVAEFGKNKIYMDEFEKAYAKNSGGYEKAKVDSISNYKKFLDLYVNYRMKLRDAFVRGYHTDEDLQKELKDYKVNIGTMFFLNNELIKPAVNQLYERRKYEYHAAHIMLRPDTSMNEEQTINLGNELINRILNGESFEKLAKEYSKDNYSKNRGGDVGFVTAGEITIPEFEDAIYSTEPGSIYPKLLKSNFAYHIIKVIEKVPRRYMIRAQHILASFKDSLGNVDSAKAYQKILEVENKIKQGEDFGKLAEQYSDDKYSAKRNGDLGFFQRHRMVPEFEYAAFKLKVGEISPIVKTDYGYHIIKVTEEKELPSFEESKNELEEMYKNTRYKKDLMKLKQDLLKNATLQTNKEFLEKIISYSDSLKNINEYFGSKFQNELGKEVIFTVDNDKVIIDSLFNYIKNKGEYIFKKLNESLLTEAINDYAGEILIRKKALEYDKVNPEFASLIKDYENGIYLFKILEEEVWSKVKVDSIMAKDYYEKNKNNFRWKDRVSYKFISVNNDSLAQVLYSLATSGLEFDSLIAKYKSQVKSNKSELVEVGTNELADEANKLQNIGEVTKPFKSGSNWYIIQLTKKEPARIKTFEEVRNEIMGILQEQESKRLEEVYINKLKKLYKPEYNYEALNQAFKQ
ncbi:peptidylprolyl isomerase [Rosettibacter firmus]|uniref:peptidylprolyl isomerase n=1 Tax=Rosettibacter firmus TaxID=3111522 RepID=UPI00336C2045